MQYQAQSLSSDVLAKVPNGGSPTAQTQQPGHTNGTSELRARTSSATAGANASEAADKADAAPGLCQRVKTFLYNDYYVPRDAILSEVTAGLIVGLAVVPEAIAFAMVCGIKPQWGVDTTLITSFVVGVFGGRPGLCNGASGAVAVVIVKVIDEHGVEYMGYTVILAGIFCMLFGFFRLANFMKLVSSSVMVGFVNALAIIIACAQVQAFKAPKDDTQAPTADPTTGPTLDGTAGAARRLLSSFDVFVDGEAWVEPDVAGWMLAEVVIVMLTMILLPLIPHGKNRSIFLNATQWIPASLIGILFATAFEHGIVRTCTSTQTRTVGDIGEMDGGIPTSLWNRGYDVPPLNSDTLSKCLPTAITLALVALIEQMMTLQLVDNMTRTVGAANREAVGLGLGNIAAGFFGGMGGNAMIGQSVICIKTGGFRRLSNLMTGTTVLLITIGLYKVVNLMPSGAFVGMMWMICYYTFEWNSFRLAFNALCSKKFREGHDIKHKTARSDVLVIVVVTAVTLFSNLALAVGCGLLINLLSFAIRSSEEVNLVRRLHVPKSGAEVSSSIDVATDDDRDVDGDAEPATAKAGTTIYEVDGPLFFGSIKKFLSLFDIDNDYANVELHCASMAIIDFSATEALVKLGSQYAEKKKRLHLKNVHPDNQSFLRKCEGMLDGDSLSDTWKEPYTAVEGTVPAVPAAPSMVVPEKDLKIWGQELQSRPALCFV